MRNYLTVWQRWANAKRAILAQHERLLPLVETIKQEIVATSGQRIPAEHMAIEGLPIKFYPFWAGWAYTYDAGWRTTPDPNENWEWTLRETESVAMWMTALQEEEVKLLFRQWSELKPTRY